MTKQRQQPTSLSKSHMSQHTIPALRTSYSAQSLFTSLSSAASNFSFSPSSTSFLSLTGAAASTPISPANDVACLSSSSRSSDGPLPITSRTTGSQKTHPSGPCPVDSVASSATTTTQSTTPIRASTDRVPKQDNTRFTSNTNIAQDSHDSIFVEGSLLASLTSKTSATSTPSTHPAAPAQFITSDLIRRVSRSKSVANFSSSPPLSLLTPPSQLITTTIVQPKATRPPSSPLQQQLPVFPDSPSAFSYDSPSCQIVPLNATTLSALCSSVAQLEETAEHFSNTGSIETAIREAHQELKRSDSRRSSLLAASVRQTASRRVSQTALRAASVHESSDLPSTNTTAAAHPADFIVSRKSSLARSRRDFSRQSSIIGLNSAARAGVLSSNDYIMSPASSIVGVGRQRSTSKTSSAGDDSSLELSRHGPGKSSVRSVQSGKQSLAEIIEHELPTAITQDALDEADRRIAAGEEHEDEDTIRASAHQHIGEVNYDEDGAHLHKYASSSSPGTDSGLLSARSVPPMARPSVTGCLDLSSAQSSAQHIRPVSTTYLEYSPSSKVDAQDSLRDAQPAEIERPATSGSGGTYQQAQTAFDDFDGVHCDPDPASTVGHPKAQQSQPASYIDSSTGQQMHFYPARVPAMLKLPPKLSKNPKAVERNARRSQVLSMMVQNNDPNPERESRAWLPDPITGDMGSPLMGPMEADQSFPATATLDDGPHPTSTVSPALGQEAARDAESGPITRPTAHGDIGQLRRPAQIADPGKRKSRTLSKLPPQLRASAFFDAPSPTAKIQLKDGSATATLDGILDASTNAPVNAFTDHAFAGHLGPEVYGVTKRRSKNVPNHVKKGLAIPEPAPPHELRTSKSRSSFMSLIGLGHVRKISEPMDGDARRPRRRLSKNFDAAMRSPGLSDGGNLMAPGDDERLSDEENGQGGEDDEGEDVSEGDEDDEVDGLADDGTPTTLLAELQLRKRQQKLRTRPNNHAFPNGMHSTLLELDTVAEIERKARKGKRVNLAWEDPALRHGNEESDDDDVPLGMLYAARIAGRNDMSAVAAEIYRPLGLMEKKEMEDNEPLSRRRDRLQGRPADAGMYLRPSQSTNALRRQNMLTPSASMLALNKAHSLSSQRQSTVEPDDADRAGDSTPPVEELDDEPLAARKLRIKAKEESQLPRAREVSMAFSEELLGQFVDPEAEAAKEQENKDRLAKANALPSEEEETLGQRRRRLQAEKEAREQEMNGIAGGLSYASGPGPTANRDSQAFSALDTDGAVAATSSDRLTRRLSMADVLAAHPLGSAQARQNPREAERIRREQEAARFVLERDQKMAAMRAQMPHDNVSAGVGSGFNKSGGFLGGRFNDGLGGISMQAAATTGSTPALYSGMSMNNMNGMNSMNNRNTIYSGYGAMSQPNLMMPNTAYNQMPVQQMPFMQQTQMQQMHMQQMQMQQMQMQQMQMGMAGQMPVQIPGQPQIDRVENWRQSIQP